MDSTSDEPAAADMSTDQAARPGRLERLLFRRVPLWLLLLVTLLGIAFAIAYGAFLLHILRGGQRLPWQDQAAA